MNQATTARMIAITAAPTPIPAIAPVLRPCETAAVVVGEGVAKDAVPVIAETAADDDDEDEDEAALDTLAVAIVTGNCVVANFLPDSDTAGPMSNTAPGVSQHV
jgi:hypothetical protein